MISAFMAAALFMGAAFGHSSNWSDGYSEPEVAALSIAIQERLERGDTEAAISLTKRFIIDHSEDPLLRQHHGHKKHRLIRGLVSSTPWRWTDANTQAAILALALKYGPLTPQYERELLYLLARSRSFEAMTTLAHLAVARAAHPHAYLSENLFDSILGRWIRTFPIVGVSRLLSKSSPIEASELIHILKRWLAQFSHPDELVGLVNASTSKQALDALPLLINLRQDWPAPISELQANRLRFWLNSKGCEGRLARPGS